ncbi:MAG: tetratricopeptide repeat protein [Deltaproteobacteria bacterium]|nr:tetratricopeptide repeat protein [Deltaproteobacteria bacterium]
MKAVFFALVFLLIQGGLFAASELPATFHQAVMLIESGKRNEASVILKELTEKNPEWGLFHLEYAANCIYLECPSNEIEKHLDKAESLLGENPRFFFYKGLFLEHKSADEALKYYDKAISLRPGYTDALIRACSLYSEKGDLKSAISYYDSIPRQQRNSALVLKMVNLLVQNKDYLRAEKELLWLVCNHPANELYLKRLIEFYEIIGNSEKAKDTTRKLQNLAPAKKKVMRPLR